MKQKKCPFRKITDITDYHWEGDTPLPAVYMEDFDYCLRDECMAWCGPVTIGAFECSEYCALMKERK